MELTMRDRREERANEGKNTHRQADISSINTQVREGVGQAGIREKGGYQRGLRV